MIGTPAARKPGEGKASSATRAPARSRSYRRRLLASTALVAAQIAGIPTGIGPFQAETARANPLDGTVSAGSAAIVNTSPTRLDINQSSNRAVIDWKSFNIGSGEHTNFNQPSAASVTLNRVTAGDPSTIAGKLTANGSLVLVNPSGVVFNKGAQVNVNSIIVTPSDISNQNFMSGNMKFDKPSPNPNAMVINEGTITVAEKGLAALVAPGVANSGVIQAKLGKVVLAGAETFAVDLYGDGLINFEVGSKVTTAPIGADGKPIKALVSNTGKIIADGGTVLLTADAVSGIVESVIDMPGEITANAAAQRGGTVTIDAGPAGNARVSGTIVAHGLENGAVGGTVTVTGDTVALASGTRIDVRGDAGGGTVKIGGGTRGADSSVRNARRAYVADNVLIDASAAGTGNGGQVTVWSDTTTVFAGQINARGGNWGGDGGAVETSSKGSLYVASTARVDTSAAAGRTGVWLLDPSDLTVTAATDSNINGGGGTYSPNGTGGSQISAATIITALATTNVTLSTVGSPDVVGETGKITVGSPIIWATNNSLNLNAAGDIVINAAITNIVSTTAGLSLIASGGITQSAAISIANLSGGSGTNTVLSNSSNAITNLGDFSVSSGNFTIANNAALTLNGTLNVGNGNVSLLTNGADASAATIITQTISGSGTGAFTLTGQNTITNLGAFGTGNNNLFVKTSGGLAVTGFVDVGSAGISINAGGVITETGLGQINAAALALTSNGAITLDNTANTISALAASSTGGNNNMTVADNVGTLSISDNINVGSARLSLTNAGVISQTGGVITAGTLTGSSNGAATFGSSNTIVNLGAFSTGGNNNFTLADNIGTLNITGTLNVGTATASLSNSGGGIVESGTGVILAGTLAGTVAGNSSFSTATNSITSLGAIATGGSNFTLVDNVTTLTVGGTLNAGSGTVSLTNSGRITQASAGTITAGTLAGSSGASMNFGATNSIGALGTITATDFALVDSVAALAIAGAVNVGLGTVSIRNSLAGSGIITESGSIIADTLTGTSSGAATFNGTNTISTLADFATGSNGNFTLVNTAGFNVGGTVSTGSGAIVLTASTGTLGVSGSLASTGTIGLNANAMSFTGQVGSPAGSVFLAPVTSGTNVFLGSASGAGLNLTAAQLNAIQATNVTVGKNSSGTRTAGTLALGAFTPNAAFATSQLSLFGSTIGFSGDAALGTRTLLAGSGGTIVQTGGIITAGTLTGYSTGAATFGSSNSITNIGSFSTGNGNFTFVDSVSTLTVGGALNAGSGIVSLTNTLAGGGVITEGASGAITAATLTGSSTGAATFGQTNTITNLGAFVSGGDFMLVDNVATLGITGAVTANSGSGIVSITNTGSITETGSGIIVAGTLTGSATSLANFGDVNTVGVIGNFTVGSNGNFTLVNGGGFNVGGTIGTGSGAVLLTANTGTLGVNVGGSIDSTGTIALNADRMSLAGRIGNSANRAASVFVAPVTAGTQLSLGGAAVAGLNLTQTQLNTIYATNVTLGRNSAGTTTAGTVDFGAFTAGSSFATSQLAVFGSPIGFSGNVDLGNTRTLLVNSGGTISQSAGIITAGTLTGSSNGAATFGDANVIGTLGAFSTGGNNDFTFVDNVTNLSLAGTLNVGTATLSLANTGSITEGAGVVIVAGTLTGSAGNDASFNSTGNTITSLGAFAVTGNHNLTFTDTSGFGVTGNVSVGTGSVSLTSTGGTISEAAGIVITAGTLTGTSNGAASFLGTNNAITSLGAFSTGGNNNFTLVDNVATLNVIGTVSAGTAIVSLTNSNGGIVESAGGVIIADTLTGSAAQDTSFGITNTIANLGSFTVSGNHNLTFSSTSSFAVVGNVNVGTGLLSLTSTGGTISEAAGIVITAGTLTGASNGVASFLGTNNAITNLGAFSTGGDNSLTLVDNVATLGVVGVVNVGTSFVSLANSGGGMLESGAGVITAGTLTGTSAGAVTFATTNTITNLGAFSTGGNNSLTLVDNVTTLGVIGAVNVGTSFVSLANSGGGMLESGAGVITAGTLTGTSAGAVTFATTNTITNLGAFSTGGNNSLTLVDNVTTLGVVGAVNVGTSFVSLANSGGGMLESGAGVITAGTLTGTSAGAATFSTTNAITNLGAFSTGGNNSLTLVDNVATLGVIGAVNVGTSFVSLANSGGGMLESGAGVITAGTLTGTSAGAVTFATTNTITNLGAFSTGGNNSLTLVDNVATLGVIGAVNVGTSFVSLTNSGGGMLESGAGVITAGTLTGTSAGDAVFGSTTNAVTNIGDFSTGGHNFTLVDAVTTLTVAGTLTATGAVVSLANTGVIAETGIILTGTLTGSSNGNATFGTMNTISSLGSFATNNGNFRLNDTIGFSVDGFVNAGAGAVSLTSGGAISETGSIKTATLSGSSTGAATFGSNTNTISSLGNFATNNGNFTLKNTIGFSVAGFLNAGTGAASLTSTGGGITEPGSILAASLTGASNGAAIFNSNANTISSIGDFATNNGNFTLNDTIGFSVAGFLNAGSGTVSLVSTGGGITESGTINAASLTGATSGDAIFDNAANTVAALGDFTTNNGNLTLADNVTMLTVAGNVNTGNGALRLVNAGAIAETGVITASTLSGSSNGNALFTTSTNAIGSLGDFSTGGGNFTLADNAPLSVNGFLDAGANGGVVTLIGTSTIGETSSGRIRAGSLGGSANGTVTLGSDSNVIARLTDFATGGGNFSLSDSSNLSITGLLNTGNGAATLNVQGTIDESGSGRIVASQLNGSSSGSALFTLANQISQLGAFTTGGGAFTLNDTIGLTIVGGLNAGTGTVTLTESTSITESGSGTITAGLLTGSTNGNALFTNASNAISMVGDFATNGGNFALGNSTAVTFGGFLNAGAGSVTLSTQSGVSENSNGRITATSLTGSAGGDVILENAGNALSQLAAFTSGGRFSLMNGSALSVNGALSTGSQIRIETKSGDLLLKANLTAAGGNSSGSGQASTQAAIGNQIVLISDGGNITQSAGGIFAGGLVVSANGAVTADSTSNAVGTLAGSAGSFFQFTNGGALTIGTVTAIGAPASNSGVSTTNGDLRLRTTNGGDLVLASMVSAGSGANNVALDVGGNAMAAGGFVRANYLNVAAAGNVEFPNSLSATANLNQVSTLSGIAGGHFWFFNSGDLTIGSVPQIRDVAARNGITTSSSSNADIIVATQRNAATGGALNFNGDVAIRTGGRVIFNTDGAISQIGTLQITYTGSFARGDVVFDNTGFRPKALADVTPSPASNPTPGDISKFPPAGTAVNTLRLDNLQAGQDVIYIITGQGAITGTITAGDLGISASGGSADLTGTIGGISGQGAAQLGIKTPTPDNNFKFNGCTIQSLTCILLPTVVPVQPQAVSEFDVLTIRPADEDSDAPVVNIFDEDRLCDGREDPKALIRGACQ